MVASVRLFAGIVVAIGLSACGSEKVRQPVPGDEYGVCQGRVTSETPHPCPTEVTRP